MFIHMFMKHLHMQKYPTYALYQDSSSESAKYPNQMTHSNNRTSLRDPPNFYHFTCIRETANSLKTLQSSYEKSQD